MSSLRDRTVSSTVKSTRVVRSTSTRLSSRNEKRTQITDIRRGPARENRGTIILQRDIHHEDKRFFSLRKSSTMNLSNYNKITPVTRVSLSLSLVQSSMFDVIKPAKINFSLESNYTKIFTICILYITEALLFKNHTKCLI